MPTERDRPFLTVKWLTKLLVGDNSCEWAIWYKAHYQRRLEEQVPSTFDFTQWRINHTALINKIREDYEQQGYTVTTERQNNFVLRGRQATLLGTPDLIAVKGNEGVIIDAKAGSPKASHPVQVMVYMYAVPIALQQHRGMKFTGHVVYDEVHADQSRTIANAAVNDSFSGNLLALIQRVSNDKPARRVSSVMECGFCDITQEQCEDRAAGATREVAETDDF